MRGVPVVLAGLLLPLTPAAAQVTTNDGALDSLAPPRAPASRPAPNRSAKPSPSPAPSSAPSHPTQAAPSAGASAPTRPAASPAKPAKPAIPATPPAILALPPAVAVPLAHPPPDPVVPLADDAPGSVVPIDNGVRVTFGTDRADFSPATAAVLTNFAAGLVSSNSTSINLFAYATGSQDDPSTPRRLSLQRALAARAVLMKAGIPSARIYPRALGSAGGEQPDRVDVVTGTPTPPPAGRPG